MASHGYVKKYIHQDEATSLYYWKCNGDVSKGFGTSKEAEKDFMWYLIETRKLAKGESVRL